MIVAIVLLFGLAIVKTIYSFMSPPESNAHFEISYSKYDQ